MTRHLRARFWWEVAVALASACLLVATVIWHTWIEVIFGVDPDQQSGALEWAIVLTLPLIAVTAGVLARQDWRRAVTVS